MTKRHIVFIGGGPRTSIILERISANRALLENTELHLHIVDPFPAGPGRIWREDQSPLLKLNSRAADVTMFTDDSVQCLGPAKNGPALDQWVQLIRDGQLTDAPALLLTDPLLQAEVASLGPGDFPTRRLQSCYLRWFFARVCTSFTAPDSIQVHEDTAVDLIPGSNTHKVLLASGEEILADQVVLVQGHLDAALHADARATEFSAHADSADHLGYTPPGYTNDINFDDLLPGTKALVSGMGLAFTDLFVLLFEGRGGRFEPTESGALHYIPSGQEPKLLAGSRRGVPYHSKIRSTTTAELTTRYFTKEAVTKLHQRHGQLDFFAHIWPLLAKETGHFYYRELFGTRPEGLHGGWDDFLSSYDAIAWYSPERASLVAKFVSLDDRLEFEELEFPLPIPRPLPAQGNRERLNKLVRDHIRQDLRLRDSPDHPQFQALFFGLLRCFVTLPLVHDKLSESGRAQLSNWWQGFFSFVDSGPPAHRLRELLALHEAGFIQFLGPETSFGFDAERQLFSAQTLSGTVHAPWLIEARLPTTHISTSTDPLLASLLRQGLITEEPGGSGKMHITSLRQAIGRKGRIQRWLFATGAAVGRFQAGAFARPQSNSASFADSDALARELLSAPATMDQWELAGAVTQAHQSIA